MTICYGISTITFILNLIYKFHESMVASHKLVTPSIKVVSHKPQRPYELKILA
jgi:hypothetical protein